MPEPLVIVAGVTGAGKSTIGTALAVKLGVPFIDADALHPPANISKMASGHPLTDDDRLPWLETIGRTLGEHSDTGLVVACSSLKRTYRDLIRSLAPRTFFVVLTGPRELIAARLAARTDHFMPPALLDSQLAAFEPLTPDERGTDLDIDIDINTIVDTGVAAVTADTTH
ncbi:gluconokinase [Subtercola sp. YIM 133946]|uniref:gluconokinase n=1 Tax=Subtercola sp. YIM 133946 TaxID=3118909 RepID=UPI002F945AAA